MHFFCKSLILDTHLYMHGMMRRRGPTAFTGLIGMICVLLQNDVSTSLPAHHRILRANAGTANPCYHLPNKLFHFQLLLMRQHRTRPVHRMRGGKGAVTNDNTTSDFPNSTLPSNKPHGEREAGVASSGGGVCSTEHEDGSDDNAIMQGKEGGVVDICGGGSCVSGASFKVYALSDSPTLILAHSLLTS